MGIIYANIGLKCTKDGVNLVYTTCEKASDNLPEKETVISSIDKNSPVYLHLEVRAGGKCQFRYSLDGKSFQNAGAEFTAVVGKWIGAKVGIFCTRNTQINDSGYADFDWFRVEGLK